MRKKEGTPELRIEGCPASILYIKLPIETKLAFKAYCAKRNISMQKEIERMVEAVLDGKDFMR